MGKGSFKYPDLATYKLETHTSTAKIYNNFTYSLHAFNDFQRKA